MRLIDADALRDAMYHEAFETDSDMQKWDGGCWIRYKLFENVIESLPSVQPDTPMRGSMTAETVQNSTDKTTDEPKLTWTPTNKSFEMR